ncbi:MAG: hypothetical protein U5N86_09990 [Planctomycetota bacterium]|nr:hypothetical protein [Planctomycetota bacterium]
MVMKKSFVAFSCVSAAVVLVILAAMAYFALSPIVSDTSGPQVSEANQRKSFMSYRTGISEPQTFEFVDATALEGSIDVRTVKATDSDKGGRIVSGYATGESSIGDGKVAGKGARVFCAELTEDGKVQSSWAFELGEKLDFATAQPHADGTVSVALTLRGSVRLSDSEFASAGSTDVLLLWLRKGSLLNEGVDGVLHLRSAKALTADGICLDEEGGVWLTGTFMEMMSCDGISLKREGQPSIYALHASGGRLLTLSGGGSQGGDKAVGITLDYKGGAWVWGETCSEGDFGGHPVASDAVKNVFVARVGWHGKWLSAEVAHPRTGPVDIVGAAVEGNGCCVAFSFEGNARVGSRSFTSLKGEDVLVLWISEFGDIVDSAQMVSSGTVKLAGMSTGPAGGVRLFGQYSGNLRSDEFALFSKSEDVFVADIGGVRVSDSVPSVQFSQLCGYGGLSSDSAHSCWSLGNAGMFAVVSCEGEAPFGRTTLQSGSWLVRMAELTQRNSSHKW